MYSKFKNMLEIKNASGDYLLHNFILLFAWNIPSDMKMYLLLQNYNNNYLK